MYWWEGDESERIYIEITGRSDVGNDVIAPVAARDGYPTSGYALVGLVRRGDIVDHYSSAAEAIVGVSRAVGGPEPAQVFWAARGSYARRAHTKPRMLPGVQVPIDSFITLEPVLGLAEIREAGSLLMDLRQTMQETYGGAIYFPWVPYGDGPIRAAQTYLAKLPRAAVNLFPRLESAVQFLETSSPQLESDETQLTSWAVADLAGKRRVHRGQGYQMNQAIKVAVEARAMDLAIAHFSELGDVEDVHGNQSFDLRCTIDATEWHIEVKGTTTAGSSVLLTPLEVKHARRYPNVCLFVVSEIEVTEAHDGRIEVSGGDAWFFRPWDIDSGGELIPIGFNYTISTSIAPTYLKMEL
jgi:Domain of unknown function (DUF3883)